MVQALVFNSIVVASHSCAESNSTQLSEPSLRVLPKICAWVKDVAIFLISSDKHR